MEVQIKEELQQILDSCAEKGGVPDWREVGLDAAIERATQTADYFAGSDHPARRPAFIAKHLLQGLAALNSGDSGTAIAQLKWAQAIILPHGRQSLRHHLNSRSAQ